MLPGRCCSGSAGGLVVAVRNTGLVAPANEPSGTEKGDCSVVAF